MQKKNILTSYASAVRRQWLHALRTLPMLLMAFIACGMNAQAQGSDTDGSEDSGWTVRVSPYLWAAGIKGKTGTLPGLPAAEVDESFSDIFDNLDLAGMVIVTARKGRFGIVGDLQYVKTSAKSKDTAPFFGDEKLTSESFIFSLLGSYLLFDKGRSNFTVSGGARLWSVSTDLKFSSGLLPGTKFEHDQTWVDPVVGVNGKTDLSSKLFLSGWGYVGGFGVGSDIMVDLFGGVGYRFTDSLSTTIGYRWLKVDYEDGDFLYDVRQQGIMAGLTYQF